MIQIAHNRNIFEEIGQRRMQSTTLIIFYINTILIILLLVGHCRCLDNYKLTMFRDQVHLLSSGSTKYSVSGKESRRHICHANGAWESASVTL